jgi:hypothetical protein
LNVAKTNHGKHVPMSRLAVVGVLALALLATACSGADVGAESDASAAAAVEAIKAQGIRSGLYN